MIMRFIASTSLALLVGSFSAMASAQAWAPGSEIVGQSMQVTTNGVTNTVHFDPNGYARIVRPGGRTVNASWAVNGQRLCLNSGGGEECWPYTQAFQAGQTVSLTSSCNVASTWVANGVNPPPRVENMSERG
jgi:hypothetical protein